MPWSLSPSSDRTAAADSGIGRQRADLLHHFDHGPIRDALPVGQAAAAHGPRIDL